MNPTRAFLDGVLKYKTLWSELISQDAAPENHFIYDEQKSFVTWALGGSDTLKNLSPGKERDSLKSIECQIMDWADDTAYSLNDLSDSVRAGFLSSGKVREWAEKNDLPFGESTPLGDLIDAINGNRTEPFAGKRIGKYIQSVSLTKSDEVVMSSLTNRYLFKMVIDEEVRAESEIYKRLAYEMVFLSPELRQLEHKGNHILENLWRVLEKHYIYPKKDLYQKYQLLPERLAFEIESRKEPNERARLVCDFLAEMTDGHASRLYKRLFVPDFGSIGDIVH